MHISRRKYRRPEKTVFLTKVSNPIARSHYLVRIRCVDWKRTEKSVSQATMRKLDSLRAILRPFSSSRRTLFQRFATLFYLTYVLDSSSIQLFKFCPSLALTSVRTPFEQPISLSLRRFSFWRYSLCISIEGLAPRQQPGSTVMPWGFRASQTSQTQKPPSFERDTKPRK